MRRAPHTSQRLRKDVRIADTAHAPPPLEGEKGRAARLPDGKAACCAKLALSRVGSVESADTQPEMRLSEKGGLEGGRRGTRSLGQSLGREQRVAGAGVAGALGEGGWWRKGLGRGVWLRVQRGEGSKAARRGGH